MFATVKWSVWTLPELQLTLAACTLPLSPTVKYMRLKHYTVSLQHLNGDVNVCFKAC